jgi:ACS family tartrate transporter-like MFS transporter
MAGGSGLTGPISFFILRFTLGLAEAGFFPGMILYFTYWFPTHHRARIVAGFMAASPVSIGLGAPVSTAFLELDGVLGLAGWKWLFLGEAAPAVIFGMICWFYLPDRPAHAKWLTPESKTDIALPKNEWPEEFDDHPVMTEALALETRADEVYGRIIEMPASTLEGIFAKLEWGEGDAEVTEAAIADLRRWLRARP